MSTTYPLISIIDGQNTFEKPLEHIATEVKPGGALQVLAPEEYITDQQRKWWKGVLLKHLSRDTGDSIHWWENRLKLAVMPDKFQPIYTGYGKQVFGYIPSITILSKNQMNQMIEGSIAELRDEEKYGTQFIHYTLPDKTKRKDWNMKIKDENVHLESPGPK